VSLLGCVEDWGVVEEEARSGGRLVSVVSCCFGEGGGEEEGLREEIAGAWWAM
jgi:hypothetical protein